MEEAMSDLTEECATALTSTPKRDESGNSDKENEQNDIDRRTTDITSPIFADGETEDVVQVESFDPEPQVPVNGESAPKGCPAINKTFTRDDEGANVTQTVPTTNAGAVASLTSSPPKRERQKTVVVNRQSPACQMVQDIFVRARQSNDFEDTERAVLALVSQLEKMSTTSNASKLADLEGRLVQSEVDQEAYRIALKSLENTMCRAIKKGGLSPGHQTNGITGDDETRIRLERELETLQTEYDNMYTMYKKSFDYIDQLKIINKELKDMSEGQKQIEVSLKEDVQVAVARYDKLAAVAQSKLNEANECIRRTESRAENDRLALKQKEAALSSLQLQLETKTRENAELNGICQQLLEKLHAEATTDEEGSITEEP